jgi:ubiquinone biosynthesis protein
MSIFAIVKSPVELREALESSGPTSRKIGQFLALRPDLIPESYCSELMNLVDHGPVVPWEAAKQVLEEDIGDPVRVFASIDTNPFAAASIAQVHAATLHDGTRVAVKIQRPGSRAEAQRDLRRIRAVARVLKVGRLSTVVDWRHLGDELAEWLSQEMDFRRELRNLERLHKLCEGDTFQRIPKPFPDLCGDRVVTMELLRGIRVSDLLRRGKFFEPSSADPNFDVDIDLFSRNLIRAVLHQVFELGFFHADMHPGNLMVLEDGVVGFVDFGLCAELDLALRRQQTRYLSAVYRRDIAGMQQALSDIVIASSASDLDAFHADFREESRKWTDVGNTADCEGASVSGKQATAGQWMVGVMTLARRHHLRLQPSSLAMYRALLGADTVAQALGSQEKLATIGRQFFQRMQIDEIVGSMSPKATEAFLLNLLALLRDAPGQLNLILSDLVENRLSFNVQMSERANLRGLRNRRTRLLAAAIASVGLAVLFASPTVGGALGPRWNWTPGVLLIIVYGAVLWHWFRLR